MGRKHFKDNDNEILYLYHQGNEEALALLIAKYHRVMMACARKHVGTVKTSCEVHDIYQVAMIALHHAVDSYQDHSGSRFSAYYKVVMKRAVQNYIRHMFSDVNRANREAISLDQMVHDQDGIYVSDTVCISHTEGNPDWEVSMKLVMEEIGNVVSKGTALEQCVYHLWVEGYSYEEIALLSDIDKKRVDNILHRLKKKLRRAITK